MRKRPSHRIAPTRREQRRRLNTSAGERTTQKKERKQEGRSFKIRFRFFLRGRMRRRQTTSKVCVCASTFLYMGIVWFRENTGKKKSYADPHPSDTFSRSRSNAKQEKKAIQAWFCGRARRRGSHGKSASQFFLVEGRHDRYIKLHSRDTKMHSYCAGVSSAG